MEWGDPPSSPPSWWSVDGEEVIARRIKSFFDNHPKFIFENIIGAGGNGIVFLVQYRNGGSSSRLALKLPPVDVDLGGYKSHDEDEGMPNEVRSIFIEKDWLQKLRGCMHIIQSMDIPQSDDPLFNIPSGMIPHRIRNWIFLEYAENGPLSLFVERHNKQYPEEKLPCRLLWRFFMCLIRAAIEMAYYDTTWHGQRVDVTTAPLESLQPIPPGPLAHLDLYGNNIVVGGLEPIIQRPEHTISPFLKVIDFGEARDIDPKEDVFNRTGSARNIMEIGEVMCYLMLLRRENNDKVQVTVNGQSFQIVGSSIVECRDEVVAGGIDPLMIDIVYHCLSLQNESRPGLIDLAMRVHEQVVNRGANGVERETDRAISKRIATLTREAETQKRTREEDENDDDDDADSEGGRNKRRKDV
ncbi:hypothetical protein F4776DRAFT_640944 [Hypoxylon sp. NC0597]|nr:hypothetical protein F4776DRAFT_640944 [Hypoxylon sp. NC0597]